MNDNFEAQRSALALRFQARAALQSVTLGELSLRFEQNTLGSSSREQMRSIAHSLAGAAGTFGFGKVSATAVELEARLASPAHLDLGQGCRALIAAIKQAAAATPATTIRRRTDVLEPRHLSIVEMPPAERTAEFGDREQSIVMVVASASVFPLLARAVESLGYLAVDALSPPSQNISPRGKVAAAIICDDIEGCHKISRGYSQQMPVLLVAADISFHNRLAAARSGVSGVLADPIDVVELAEWLAELAPRKKEQSYSILIVDGDSLLAEAYALELRIAGMATEIVTDGTVALERIAATSPDLVLLDTQLPGVNGIELAKIIRQLRRDLSLPIVFLSAESDPHIRLEARTFGGDDFISKPVDRKALISLIALRAKRGIELRSLVDKDGLTGLLNYGQFMTRLSNELERCRRTGAQVSMALIDLDHFAQVNELHGYLAGDRVIRALGHALTARLRRIDVVARYKGAAFGVILLDTSPGMVGVVFDQIREGFAGLGFDSPGLRFKVTVSVGLAGSRQFDSAERLLAAARDALKEAKQSGRNRVETSTSIRDDVGADVGPRSASFR